MIIRCDWCLNDQAYIDYHDKEWGVPVRDDQLLFEFLSLEGAQAGLSWLTVLKRRDEYRKAFLNFNIKKVSQMTQKNEKYILENSGVIKNKLKIKSVINNAKLVIELQKKDGSFSNFIWQYVDNKPINHSISDFSKVPVFDDIALAISKDLKNMGFNFVGPTICYAFMQAIGMVNDHKTDCFRYKTLNNHSL